MAAIKRQLEFPQEEKFRKMVIGEALILRFYELLGKDYAKDTQDKMLETANSMFQ